MSKFDSFVFGGESDDEDFEDEAIATDELSRYFRLRRDKTVKNPIAWWKDKQVENDGFPQLSRLALDILSIPAMATETERLFSLAKLLMTSQRLSLADESVCQTLCLKSWMGHVQIPFGGIIRASTRLG